MKKLVQLKNKENENLDPINFNYEKRLQKLENNDYSTEEQVIGKWVDGKPLYRITVIGTTPATAETWGDIGTVPTGISVKNMNGIIGGYLPAPSYITANYYVSLQYNGIGKLQAFVKGYTNATISVTLEYTK